MVLFNSTASGVCNVKETSGLTKWAIEFLATVSGPSAWDNEMLRYKDFQEVLFYDVQKDKLNVIFIILAKPYIGLYVSRHAVCVASYLE